MHGWVRLAVRAVAAMSFVCHSSAAGAHVISVISNDQIYGQDLTVTTAPNSISVTNFFDRYDDAAWQITSAVQDPVTGRIAVTYNWERYGNWDSYGAYAFLEFQILSDSGSSEPEAVSVDFWGSSFYEHHLSGGGCCYGNTPPEVTLRRGPEGTGPVRLLEYAADYDASYSVLSESLVLYTNTLYSLEYRTNSYVEGTPESRVEGRMRSFASWEDFATFVSTTGSSGLVVASARGFMNFDMSVSPVSVPEPGTLLLLGIGLVGVGVGRRRGRIANRTAPV